MTSDFDVACAQHSRIAGSGCVSSSDLEAAWPAAVAGRVRALVLDECVRPDGRGLRDVRRLRQEARAQGLGLGFKDARAMMGAACACTLSGWGPSSAHAHGCKCFAVPAYSAHVNNEGSL